VKSPNWPNIFAILITIF